MNRKPWHTLRKIIPFAVVLCLAVPGLYALDVPPLKGPVNDLASVMTAAQREELTSYLMALDEQTSVQMAVLTVPSLEGDSLESFAEQVFKTWKLGQAGKDNGALLLVVMDERAVRIEVGYGLESELTDIKSGLIIREVIIPAFQDGRYGAGITAGIKNMAGIATGNEEIVSKRVREGGSSGSGTAGIFFSYVFFLFMIVLIAASRRGRRRGRRYYGGGPYYRGGGSSGSSFSSRGGGSSGGSSFSGGGGRSGGGGASGRW
ncbi:TPM domain-containing protein [Breznakiella homolactica]|uniref:TPM domain-containing protein n=1 Tax=Breznakiella homolactica TaxID=2798577 RepID=A0A7T8BA22_9SPIR|nr:TPM domain-containing protein [Breznakiella homolactica]QQO08916.1 TPM domain-containing protein [Breznakiella homolactica]